MSDAGADGRSQACWGEIFALQKLGRDFCVAKTRR